MLTSTTVNRAVYFISMSLKKNYPNKMFKERKQADGWLGSLCNQTTVLMIEK